MTFNQLPIGELRRLADEVYPVALSEEESKDKTKAAAALEAVGAKWVQYLEAHASKEIKEKFADDLLPVTEPAAGVITSADVTGRAPEVVVEPEVRIITKEAPVAIEKYLIKMTRENPVYQVGQYKFTKDHPYALVDGKDVGRLLSEEEGFRQAFPDEIDDFYN